MGRVITAEVIQRYPVKIANVKVLNDVNEWCEWKKRQKSHQFCAIFANLSQELLPIANDTTSRSRPLNSRLAIGAGIWTSSDVNRAMHVWNTELSVEASYCLLLAGTTWLKKDQSYTPLNIKQCSSKTPENVIRLKDMHLNWYTRQGVILF